VWGLSVFYQQNGTSHTQRGVYEDSAIRIEIRITTPRHPVSVVKLHIFHTIRDWLTVWFDNHTSSDHESQQTQSLSEHTPVELPTALKLELLQDVQSLLPHPIQYQAIEQRLTASLQAFNEHSEAPNSLIVLGNPSDMLSLTVHKHLEQWLRHHTQLEAKGDRPPTTFSLMTLCSHWNHRPSDLTEIVSQLKSELQTLESSSFSQDTLPIVFLPLMEWCFLRCVDGFAGIDHLQDYILSDRSRFWVIGCNSWTWTYLDYVCQISSYFEQTMMLPALSGHELKEWLSPIAEKVDLVVEPDEDEATKQLALTLDTEADEPDNWLSSREKRFYEKLATDSRGLSKLAADLWVRSLSVADDEVQETPEGDASSSDTNAPNHHETAQQSGEASSDNGSRNASVSESSQQKDDARPWPRLKQKNVSAPKLLTLNVSDRHILYSVLLHGQISIPHLAQSLGDETSIVRAKVQLLLRAGVLNRHHDHIQVDPAYYLSIRSDLERNNFLVGAIAS
jgi:hypothetical protein